MTNPKFSAGVAAAENRFRGATQDEIAWDRWNMLSAAVCGPELTEAQRATFDRMVVAITVADPRIWPLTITRLAANYDKPGTALAMAQLAMDESPIGPYGFRVAAEYLTATTVPQECPPGFGVKARAVDERVALLDHHLEGLSSPEIDRFRATIEQGWSPHISGICAAILLAFGFDPLQIHLIAIDLHQAAFIATVYDGIVDGYSPILDDLGARSD